MILLKGHFCSLATVSTNILVVFALVILFLFVPDTCLVRLSCTPSLINLTFKASSVSGFKKVQIPDVQHQRDGESVPADHSLHVTALYDSQGLQAWINKLWDVLSHWPTGGGGGGLSHVFFCIRKNSNIVNEHVGLWVSTSRQQHQQIAAWKKYPPACL